MEVIPLVCGPSVPPMEIVISAASGPVADRHRLGTNTIAVSSAACAVIDTANMRLMPSATRARSIRMSLTASRIAIGGARLASS
jgi:hypothetical protein